MNKTWYASVNRKAQKDRAALSTDRRSIKADEGERGVIKIIPIDIVR